MQQHSDLSGDILDSRAHVPGPPSQVAKPQASSAVPSEPLTADASRRKAIKAAVAERHHANRHPDNCDHERRKGQNACGDEYRQRQTDTERWADFHFVLALRYGSIVLGYRILESATDQVFTIGERLTPPIVPQNILRFECPKVIHN
jgi:hypothetical protein